MAFPPIKFHHDQLFLLDQRKLPLCEVWISCRDSKKVHWAIREMVVRGAPAIGVAAGYGLYLGIKKFKGTAKQFFIQLKKQGEYLKSSRPTGVNLRNVIDAMAASMGRMKSKQVETLKKQVLTEARKIHKEDDRLCRAIGKFGSALFQDGDSVLTHCNAGGLATSGYGTALGVIYAVKASGKKISVYADETRPLLQGARLTAWELSKSKIPCTLICDNSAAAIMRQGKIDRIVVGADRIAANGDTANKIGTYNVAVLAKEHKIPFYIAAPGTTFDFKIKSGRQIPIEERKAEEVTHGMGKQTAPKGIKVSNLAFDVTPYAYITAFITECGVLKPPFSQSFKKLKERSLP